MKNFIVLLSVLSLSLPIGVSAKQNTKPKQTKKLQPSAQTAKKCVGLDTPQCNQVYDECQNSKSKQCREFRKEWRELTCEEYGEENC